MNQGRQQHGWFGHGTSRLDSPQNVRDLASVIETEAGGETDGARIAVGFVAVNRMRRNGESDVRSIWNGFAHHVVPGQNSLKIARNILADRIKDPTEGATHFYTPARMPKEGESTGGRDVQGGLESVPGVTNRTGGQ